MRFCKQNLQPWLRSITGCTVHGMLNGEIQHMLQRDFIGPDKAGTLVGINFQSNLWKFLQHAFTQRKHIVFEGRLIENVRVPHVDDLRAVGKDNGGIERQFLANAHERLIQTACCKGKQTTLAHKVTNGFSTGCTNIFFVIQKSSVKIRNDQDICKLPHKKPVFLLFQRADITLRQITCHKEGCQSGQDDFRHHVGAVVNNRVRENRPTIPSVTSPQQNAGCNVAKITQRQADQ